MNFIPLYYLLASYVLYVTLLTIDPAYKPGQMPAGDKSFNQMAFLLIAIPVAIGYVGKALWDEWVVAITETGARL